MELKLNKLNIENFKGIKSFVFAPDGENAVIKAENGAGKTTLYDAFLWLLFGKDSTGRKDFGIRPLDNDHNIIKGLVVAVEAGLSIDGVVHTLKKEQNEKLTKGEFRGHETLCWLDEVPKKVGEFADYITSIIPEDTFKLLTDLQHFNSKLHWTDRRKVLLDIAGEIGTPEGFDKLIAALNGRTVEEYKKVLAERKKRLTEEQKQINPRIDELNKGLENFAGANAEQLEAKREDIKAGIARLDEQRKILFEQESRRQAARDRVDELKSKKAGIEYTLKTDTSGIEKLLNKKNIIMAGISKIRQSIADVESKINVKTFLLTGKKTEFQQHLTSLQTIRKEYEKAEAAKEEICPTCGQKMPENKESESLQKAILANIIKKGNDTKDAVEKCRAKITEVEAELEVLNSELAKVKAELSQAEAAKIKRFAEIDEAVKNRPAPDFNESTEWKKVGAEIAKAEKQIGQPVSEQLQQIESQKQIRQNELTEVNNALAQADRSVKDKARIAELEEKEKQLAQQIADVARQLSQVGEYQAAESKAVEEAVNGKFEHTAFKLFDTLINGEIIDCCEAMLNGVPYGDMSTGETIFVGIDIINVLSNHYGVSVPMFIDHSESFTLAIEAKTQTIELYAQLGITELTVGRKEAMSNV
jgi:DNA repair exonuclease SbcCD ATPase subunit